MAEDTEQILKSFQSAVVAEDSEQILQSFQSAVVAEDSEQILQSPPPTDMVEDSEQILQSSQSSVVAEDSEQISQSSQPTVIDATSRPPTRVMRATKVSRPHRRVSIPDNDQSIQSELNNGIQIIPMRTGSITLNENPFPVCYDRIIIDFFRYILLLFY
jgi:hypothetical protein